MRLPLTLLLTFALLGILAAVGAKQLISPPSPLTTLRGYEGYKSHPTLSSFIEAKTDLESQTEGQDLVEKIMLPAADVKVGYDGSDSDVFAVKFQGGGQVAVRWKSNYGAERLVLFYHGNAEDIGGAPLDALSQTFNADVMAVEFPGYGQSTGAAAEDEINSSMVAVASYAASIVGARNMVLVGRSIGTGIATYTAVEMAKKGENIQGLMLVSPYTKADELVRHFASAVVSMWVSGSWWNTVGTIGELDCPVLVVHSDNDEVVPYKMGVKVAKAAKYGTLKTIKLGHNNVYGVYTAYYTQTWAARLQSDSCEKCATFKSKLSKCTTIREKGEAAGSSVWSYLGALSASSSRSSSRSSR